MPGFEDAWWAVNKSWGAESVSRELRPFLQSVYCNILSSPIELRASKTNLERLLEFLANEGRTNAKCWATDMFFTLSEGWERDWVDQNLPGEFHDVLSLMGQALHDTVRSPEIASNFDCLPGQLLARVKSIRI